MGGIITTIAIFALTIIAGLVSGGKTASDCGADAADAIGLAMWHCRRCDSGLALEASA